MPEIFIEPGASTNSAFTSAASTAVATLRSGTPSDYVDPLGTTVIQLEPGDYTVTEVNAILGLEGLPSNTFGLVIRGAGSALTTVIFSPETAGSLMTNQYWYGVRVEGIRFVATTSGCTFMATDTDTGSAQDYIFTDCTWQGWQYVFDLTGVNNNSEYRFIGCQTYEIETGGAFLYVGTTDTSDQFVNYWFYGFKHWETSAPLIDSSAGGHYHLFGVDCSGWGGAGDVCLFNLHGGQHNSGTCTFTCEGLRVEIASATSSLFYCEWEYGNIELQVDMSSLTYLYTYGSMFNFVWLSDAYGPGPIYRIHDSCLAGAVTLTGTPQAGSYALFENCQWSQQTTPSAVISDTQGVVFFNGCAQINDPPGNWVNSLPGTSGSALLAPTGPTTVTSPTSTSGTGQTQMASLMIPANTPSAGQSFKAQAFGSQSASAGTLTFEIHLGTNNSTSDPVVASVAPTVASSGSSYFEGLLTIRTTGSSGTCIASGIGVGSDSVVKTATSTQTVDTTAVNYLTVSIAVSAGTHTCQQAVVAWA